MASAEHVLLAEPDAPTTYGATAVDSAAVDAAAVDPESNEVTEPERHAAERGIGWFIVTVLSTVWAAALAVLQTFGLAFYHVAVKPARYLWATLIVTSSCIAAIVLIHGAAQANPYRSLVHGFPVYYSIFPMVGLVVSCGALAAFRPEHLTPESAARRRRMQWAVGLFALACGSVPVLEIVFHWITVEAFLLVGAGVIQFVVSVVAAYAVLVDIDGVVRVLSWPHDDGEWT